MRSVLTLSLSALLVSSVLSGCSKSGGTPSVIETKPKQLITEPAKQAVESKAKNAKSPNTAPPAEKTTNTPIKSNEDVQDSKPVEMKKPIEVEKKVKEVTKPTEVENKVEETTKPVEIPNETQQSETGTAEKADISPANEDNLGKIWRAIPLSNRSSLVDSSDQRDGFREHFVMPSSHEDDSPFISSEEDDKEYNHKLAFELGRNEKNSNSTISLLKGNGSYLGKHEGVYKDNQLEGRVVVERDGEEILDSQPVHQVNYLYINQPYTTFGALFTNENDSNLFNIRLKTGKAGQKVQEEGKGDKYAEYGVYTVVGKNQVQWNKGLEGTATYQGDVIARVERRDDNGNDIASSPTHDGTVTLNVELNSKWDQSHIKGHIDSKSLGRIELHKTNILGLAYSTERVGFSGESHSAKNDNLNGNYVIDLVGEHLNDAVGDIFLENEADDISPNDVIKYNAVFGGTKQ